MKIKQFIAMSICLISSTCFAQTNWHQQLTQLLNTNLTTANTGIVVINARSGKTLYARRAYNMFSPASTLKLFTATAALIILKPDFYYTTAIRIKPNQLKDHTLHGNLIIQFSGDPSLTRNDIKALIHSIKQYGIHHIQGNVILSGSKFHLPGRAPGWTNDSLYWAYSAPTNDIIINENKFGLKFIPSKTLGHRVRMLPEKHMASYIHIQSHVTTVTYEKSLHLCRLVLKNNRNNALYLSGCWPINVTGWQQLAIENPTLYAEQLITHQLKQEQISLSGHVIHRKLPSNTKIIIQHTSKPLKDLVKHMLKESDNVYAESILKTIGMHYHQPSTQESIYHLKQILGKFSTVDVDDTNIVDGSGLSRYDLISPNQEINLLYSIYQDKKLYSILYKALPIAGVDGTLRYRMEAKPLRTKVHAKTGSMTGISTLSGYITTQHHQPLIFVIMVNNILGKIKKAQILQDKICSILYYM